MSNQNLVRVLNRFLSNINVLNVKLYNFHWFVKGKGFFTLHEKFQELYESKHELIDEVAERILMINGSPLGTIKEFVEHATLDEAKGNESAEEMVASLVNDYELLIKELEEGIALAGDLNDQPTEDLLIGVKGEFEKQVWMLKSYLG